MNFLGHCLFSNQTPDGLIGSLWPDFAPRPKQPISTEFSTHFDRHQSIDKFTDQCSELEPVRQSLRPIYRKTSPIVLDVIIDHHLAKHWSYINDQPLDLFAQQCYQQMQRFPAVILNERFNKTLFWMREQDWFSAYAHQEGIEGALKGMSKRIKFNNPLYDNVEQACDCAYQHSAEIDNYLKALLCHLNLPHPKKAP